MNTQWTEYEDDALQGLPHLAQLLYLRVLRRHVDYETGIVGRYRRISYQMMREVLEVRRPSRSPITEERITTKSLRVAIDQLETAGLVRKLPKSDRRDPQEYMLLKAQVGSNFLDESDGIGLVCPREVGQKKGKGSGAEEGQSGNVVIMRSAQGYPHVSGAKEGQRKWGSPLLEEDQKKKIAAPVDNSQAEFSLGQALEMMVEAGARPSTVTNQKHRACMKAMLDIGVTRDELQLAIDAAIRTLGNEPFTVFYVEKIVTQRRKEQANRPGDRHATHQLPRKGRRTGIDAMLSHLFESDSDET